jgi:hypothetical protein
MQTTCCQTLIRGVVLCQHSHSTILPLDLGCVYSFTAFATTAERETRGLLPVLKAEEELLRAASIVVAVGLDRSVVGWRQRSNSGQQMHMQTHKIKVLRS